MNFELILPIFAEIVFIPYVDLKSTNKHVKIILVELAHHQDNIDMINTIEFKRKHKLICAVFIPGT